VTSRVLHGEHDCRNQKKENRRLQYWNSFLGGILSQCFTGQTKQLVLDELDLELALKDRVANTLQSRITWALLLQESLEKDLNGDPHPFSYL
jgi:hypothetical protein